MARARSKGVRLLTAVVALLCALPMLVMGATPATAAVTIPVYDLDKQILPPEYAFVRFDTAHDGITGSDVTDVDGFRVEPAPNAAGTYLYYPTRQGASLLFRNAGELIDSATGQSRPLWAKYTVHNYYQERLVLTPNTFAIGGHFNYVNSIPQPNPKDTSSEWTVTLIDSATGQPLTADMKGSTGFIDLDGPDPNQPNPDHRFEGVELLSGFNGAYVRSDVHLKQYGVNGWMGDHDENRDEWGTVHAFQHYLGATFTGGTLRVRHKNGSATAFNTAYSPFNSTVPYRLHYDPNASDTVGNTPKNTGVPNDMSTTTVMHGCYAYYPSQARINLATGAKDADCWDSSQLTRPHHTFIGWSRDPKATEPEAQIVMPKHDETVYAIWVPNVRFTYDADKPADYTGAMPGVPDAREFSPGATVPNTSPWKTGATTIIRGWRFDGWRTGRDDTSAVYGFDTTPITQDTTVYGSWTPLTINLHYDANGGEGSHPSQNTRWDTTVTIPDDVNGSFHRDGFTLTGWNTQADGKGTAYQPGKGVPMVDHDVTLYAQWAPVATTMPETGSATLAWLIGGGALVLLIAVGAGVLVWRIRRKA